MTTKIHGYCKIDGYFCGIHEPIRFDDGSIGWQITDTDGQLIGLVDSFGHGDSPFAGGNRSWKLCEETPEHKRALRAYASDTRAPMRLIRK